MSQPLVFISYSHKDEAQKNQLVTHLKVLGPDLLNPWSDDRLGAGVDWEPEIDRALSQARVAILLITADYLNSDFIRGKEVPKLLERREREGLTIIPVIAKSCAWRWVDWLNRMNVRPRDGAPVWGNSGGHADEDLTAIAEEVAEIIRREPTPKEAGEAAAGPPPAEGAEAPGADERAVLPAVLVVEDDEGYRRSVVRILRDAATCHEAGSVADSLKVLDAHKNIRVIVLDLMLPDADGTHLLEYINNQNADYRVIVLTAHGELMGADMAARYRVFSYLAKSPQLAQSLRFEVEQAFKDLERASSASKDEGEDFDYVIVNRYPTPFTYVYQQLKAYTPSLEKLKHQTDIFELLLNFSAVVLMCEYLSGGARNAELDAFLREKMSKPGLGEWFNIINEILKRKGDLRETAFLTAFSNFYSSKNKRRVGDLIAMRNRILGHGAAQNEYEYEAIVKQCDDLLVPLLQDYKFITQFLLCQATSVERTRKGLLYKLRECTGKNPQLLFTQKTLGMDLNANEMYLINLDNGQHQSLYPFIILEYCKKCSQPEIFFYTKFAGDSLRYLSYKTNHRFSNEDSVQDFKDLLGLHS